jgi:hypothetical protein
VLGGLRNDVRNDICEEKKPFHQVNPANQDSGQFFNHANHGSKQFILIKTGMLQPTKSMNQRNLLNP